MCDFKLVLSAKKIVVRLESLFGVWNEVLASLSVFFFTLKNVGREKKLTMKVRRL